MDVSGYDADGGCQALLHDDEIFSRTIAKNLGDCTFEERVSFVNCYRSTTVFLLESTRELLSNTRGKLRERYQSNTKAFHVRNPPIDGDFYVMDNLRALESQFLTQLQFSKGLCWHLGIPSPKDNVSNKTAPTHNQMESHDSRENVVIRGLAASDDLKTGSEKQAFFTDCWPLPVPSRIDNVDSTYRNRKAENNVSEHPLGSSGPIPSPTSHGLPKDQPHVSDCDQQCMSKEGTPSGETSNLKSLHWHDGDGESFPCTPTSEGSPTNRPPFFSFFPPTASTTSTCASRYIHQWLARAKAHPIRGPLNGQQRAASQGADTEFDIPERRWITTPEDSKKSPDNFLVKTVYSEHIPGQQNKWVVHDITGSDNEYNNGSLLMAKDFGLEHIVPLIPESRQTANTTVLIDVAGSEQIVDNDVLFNLNKRNTGTFRDLAELNPNTLGEITGQSTGELIDLDNDADISESRQGKFQPTPITPINRSHHSKFVFNTAVLEELTPISQFESRADTTRKSNNNALQAGDQSLIAPQDLDWQCSTTVLPLTGHFHDQTPFEIAPTFLFATSRGDDLRHEPATKLIPKQDFKASILNNEAERQAAIRANRDSDDNVPYTLKFGVQFSPSSSTAITRSGHERKDFLCQSVIISHLPADAELRDVMSRVRGGNIIQATLVNTTSLLVGRTAIVVFVRWEEAHAYVKYAKDNPCQIVVLGQQANVNLAGKPTYPRRGFQLPQGDQTRCLRFRWAPEGIDDQLFRQVEHLNRHVEDTLEDMWRDDTGSVVMLFKNVDFAIRLDNLIRKRDEYLDHAHNLEFIDDPCGAPLKSLRNPVRYARDGHPSLLEDWLIRKHSRGCVRWQYTLPERKAHGQLKPVLIHTPGRDPQITPTKRKSRPVSQHDPPASPGQKQIAIPETRAPTPGPHRQVEAAELELAVSNATKLPTFDAKTVQRARAKQAYYKAC